MVGLVSMSTAGPTADQRVAESSSWVDRQPMYLISLYTGIYTDGNPMGLVPQYNAPDGVDWLLDRIRVAYKEHGARRFFINRPMGCLPTGHVPGGSWLTTPKRYELAEKLVALQLDELTDIEVIFFVGTDTQDPRSNEGRPRESSEGFYSIGDTSTPERLTGTRATIGGWISTGASGLAFDHSATTEEYQQYLDLHGQLAGFCEIIGEAYPLSGGFDLYGRRKINMEAVERMPYIATLTNIFDQGWLTGGPPIRFDPETTQLYVWINLSSEQIGNGVMMARWLHANGLIAVSGNPELFMEAMRLWEEKR
tara:strand:+ start:390289 stop:391215 length:927 start_codon:yes stop_codon:yes gene_type:complete